LRTTTPALLFGVGAAFDFHADMIGLPPAVMRVWGLEWLYRLVTETRRHWRSYLTTNWLFIAYLAQDFWRERGKSRPDMRS
jgi:N-acetylglucosaminyldiphosphoundecaprenol N-acetyl-beta-D-mannosaminyltransferase